MPFARSPVMSAIRSTFWGIALVLALVIIAVFAYGNCSVKP